MPFRVLALIPARSGSKGLRHKNVRKIAGKPLLLWAIELAQTSLGRDESRHVVVSTDAPRYARIALQAGASVPFLRPADLASDDARLIDVVHHALDVLQTDQHGFDAVLMLSPTTPLTQARDVRRALTLFRKYGGERSVVSVYAESIPDSWRFTCAHGTLVNVKKRVQKRQESPQRYVLNGAIYVASPTWLRKNGQFFVSGTTLGHAMPKSRSLDIENSDDLRIAAALIRLPLVGQPG